MCRACRELCRLRKTRLKVAAAPASSAIQGRVVAPASSAIPVPAETPAVRPERQYWSSALLSLVQPAWSPPFQCRPRTARRLPPRSSRLHIGGATIMPPKVKNAQAAVFSMQQQLESEWCWAAVAQAIKTFFSPNSAITQCTIAQPVLTMEQHITGATNCCENPTACNVPATLQDALK